MSKIIKNIPVFLLWIAGLAFCAHLTIPHDHHSEDTCTDQEDTCPATNGKADHTSGYPIHCHAFNCVASEKATTFSLTKTTQCNEVSICGFSDYFTFDQQLPCITIFEVREPFPNSYLLVLFLLRAPPSFS